MKQEEQVGINKVQRIMQKYQWQCQVKVKKKNRPGSAYYQTENHLNRNFQASQPLEKLTTDITTFISETAVYIYQALWICIMEKSLPTPLAKNKTQN